MGWRSFQKAFLVATSSPRPTVIEPIERIERRIRRPIGIGGSPDGAFGSRFSRWKQVGKSGQSQSGANGEALTQRFIFGSSIRATSRPVRAHRRQNRRASLFTKQIRDQFRQSPSASEEAVAKRNCGLWYNPPIRRIGAMMPKPSIAERPRRHWRRRWRIPLTFLRSRGGDRCRIDRLANDPGPTWPSRVGPSRGRIGPRRTGLANRGDRRRPGVSAG